MLAVILNLKHQTVAGDGSLYFVTINLYFDVNNYFWVIFIFQIASFIIHMIMDGITYSLGTYLTLFTENFNVSHGAAR